MLKGLGDGGVYLEPCLTEDLRRRLLGAALPRSGARLGLRRLLGLRLSTGLRWLVILIGVWAREVWGVPRTRHPRTHTPCEVLRRDRLDRVGVADQLVEAHRNAGRSFGPIARIGAAEHHAVVLSLLQGAERTAHERL